MKKVTVTIAAILTIAFGGAAFAERGVCAKNGGLIEIDFAGNERAITSGHTDMKPSWSLEGDQIVFFRVIKMTDNVRTWRTSICVVNADGTGFRQLTDGNYADYNPTWTKDGSHRIYYSRFFPIQGQSVIHRIDFSGAEPRDEIVSDPKRSEYALSALRDGRLLVSSNRSVFEGVYWLFTPGDGVGPGKYDLVKYKFALRGFMDRCSISPDERHVAYEYKYGFESFSYVDKIIYLADFDPATATISNPRKISPRAERAMTLYPRWTTDGSSVVYHSYREGSARLYRYRIADGSTETIAGDRFSTYEFFCGERWPK